MPKANSLVWFRQDLRVTDNPALNHALEGGESILAAYIYNKKDTEWKTGGASQVFLHYSLESLQKSLKNIGIDLQIIKSSNTLKSLEELVNKNDIQKIFWNRVYEPDFIERDKKIKTSLTNKKIEVQTFKGALLWEPWEILQSSGKPYQVFTPFYKACLKASFPLEPSTSRAKTPKKSFDVKGDSLESLNLLPKLAWGKDIETHWKISEDAALKQLDGFVRSTLSRYEEARNIPSLLGTSRLSPYLHFGILSPRQIWARLQKEKNSNGKTTFEKEIIWREFAHHLLFHFPHTPTKPLRVDFEKFLWKTDSRAFEAWCRGKTGYPIVDAGMRELWKTGWMHNRVRMIVASFLIKDLRIHWLKGAEWFWDTLVDADLANNTLGWQWSAGCGADAAPFFRIFNPYTQSEKFDPNGDYIRKWIPELKNVPSKFIHAPHLMSPEEQKKYGCLLKKDYPFPIVDHAVARNEALKAFKLLRKK